MPQYIKQLMLKHYILPTYSTILKPAAKRIFHPTFRPSNTTGFFIPSYTFCQSCFKLIPFIKDGSSMGIVHGLVRVVDDFTKRRFSARCGCSGSRGRTLSVLLWGRTPNPACSSAGSRLRIWRHSRVPVFLKTQPRMAIFCR